MGEGETSIFNPVKVKNLMHVQDVIWEHVDLLQDTLLFQFSTNSTSHFIDMVKSSILLRDIRAEYF